MREKVGGVGGDEVADGRPQRREPRRKSHGAHGLREGLAKDPVIDHRRAIERRDDARDVIESLFEHLVFGAPIARMGRRNVKRRVEKRMVLKRLRRIQVRVLDEPADGEIVVDVDPEERRERSPHLEHDTAHPDVSQVDRLLPISSGKVRGDTQKERKRNRRDDGPRGVVASGSARSQDPRVREVEPFDGARAMNPSALRDDGFHQSIDERVRTSVEKTQPLLENAVSGAREPVNAAPDPGGGDCIGLVGELLAKKRLPHHSIGLLPSPLEQPVARGNVLELLPLGPALRGKHVEPVAEARGEGERREPEKRKRVAEGVRRSSRKTAIDVRRQRSRFESPRRSSQRKYSWSAAAKEVIELLDPDGAEIERAREAARPLRRFEDLDLVAIFQEIRTRPRDPSPRPRRRELSQGLNAIADAARRHLQP